MAIIKLCPFLGHQGAETAYYSASCKKLRRKIESRLPPTGVWSSTISLFAHEKVSILNDYHILILRALLLCPPSQLHRVKSDAPPSGLCVLHGRLSRRDRGASEPPLALLHWLPAVSAGPVGAGHCIPVPPDGTREMGRSPQSNLHPVWPHEPGPEDQKGPE